MPAKSFILFPQQSFIFFPQVKSKDGTLPIFSEVPASDAFIEAFSQGSSPVLQCQLCTRVLYNSTGEYMDEENELQNLEKEYEENPEKYIPIDHQIHQGTIEGNQVLMECPCNGIRLFENFIWNNSKRISQYLCERSDKEFKYAQTEKDSAENAKKALNQEI